MKSIILLNPYENHSNRLFQNMHAEAFCIENQIQYYNPSFSDIACLYNSPCNCCFPQNMKFFEKFLCAVMKNNLVKKSWKKIFPFGFCNFYYFKNELEGLGNYIFKKFQKQDNFFVGGFNFRFPELTQKYQDLFVEKYSLKENYYINNKFIEDFFKRKKNKIAIGFHIRRGDYKTYKNGIYFFEDKVYKKYMDNIEKEIEKNFGKKALFIICSNEKTKFENNAKIIISKENWFIDQYILSKCDYIIGVPSTFSRWASFIGKKPIFHIIDNSGEISLNKFEFCIE